MRAGFFAEKIAASLSRVKKTGLRESDRPALYLHIGLPKTGTSAIQNFFFQNREILKKKGILYPDLALHWSQHVPVAKAIFSPIFPKAHFNRLIESVDMASWYEGLLNGCSKDECSKVVISSDFFWAAPAMQSALSYHEPTEDNYILLEQAVAACKKAFSWFDTVKVIVYLRRQDQWLESFFNQQIKDGFSIPTEPELLPCKNYLLFSKNLSIWEQYFGQDNILVRNFSACNGDVVKDFCRLLSVHDDAGLVSPSTDARSANLRLSPRAVQTMRFALENNMDKATLDLLGEVLRYTSSRGKQGDASGVFSTDFHRQVLSVYEQDNCELAKRYPVCADFCNSAEPAPCPSTDIPASSPEEQVEILLQRLLPAYVAEVSKL